MVTVTDALRGPALTVPWRRDGWTVDDLPEDVDVRYELVDGSLVVSPSPDLRHDDLDGIPHFWRVEFEPLVLVAHSLVEGGYREHARFADEVVVSDPVPLHFRLTDLLV